MAIAAHMMFQFISITLFKGFCSELHRMLRAKFSTIRVPLELALLAVHLGCRTPGVVRKYACTLVCCFCCNNRLRWFGDLVRFLELVPTCLNLDSFFACPKHRVCTLFRLWVLSCHRLVVQFLPEVTPLALWRCKGWFFSYRGGCNMHTSVPILD